MTLVGTLGKDCTFELDDFYKPRLRNEAELVKNTILSILFMRPGQYPSLPQIGMDIRQKLYSFYDELNIGDLETQLIEQCEALQLSFNKGDIVMQKTLYKDTPSLLIKIKTDTNDSWAASYIRTEDERNNTAYYIGITLDELKDVIYSVNQK